MSLMPLKITLMSKTFNDFTKLSKYIIPGNASNSLLENWHSQKLSAPFGKKILPIEIHVRQLCRFHSLFDIISY